MNTYLSRPSLIVSLAAAIATAVPASAGLVITFEESGSDVVATLSGSFASLPTPDSTPEEFLYNGMRPQGSFFTSNNNATPPSPTREATNQYLFTGGVFPAFGTSAVYVDATATSGQNTSFQFVSTALFLSQSYAAGTEFTGSLTWAGSSIASLQLTPGSYSATLSNAETVTLNVVPEPTTSALAFAGVGCCAVLAARRARRHPQNMPTND